MGKGVLHVGPCEATLVKAVLKKKKRYIWTAKEKKKKEGTCASLKALEAQATEVMDDHRILSTVKKNCQNFHPMAQRI